MSSPTEIEVETATGSTSSDQFFKICYLTAITVATLGWLSAFGWVTVRIASWVLA